MKPHPKSHYWFSRAGWRTKAGSSLCPLVCNWIIILLAETWNFSVFKRHPFALGRYRYVSNSFQSGKKIVTFSYLLIKIVVFSLILVSN